MTKLAEVIRGFDQEHLRQLKLADARRRHGREFQCNKPFGRIFGSTERAVPHFLLKVAA